MDEQQRPFGLTLMTGLNLGIALYNLGAAIQFGFAIAVKMGWAQGGVDLPIAIGLGALPFWFTVFLFVAAVVKLPLLVISGLGYYTYRERSRWFGTAYAIVSIIESLIAVQMFGFFGGTVIGLLYPVFTLLAVHGPFKERLVR